MNKILEDLQERIDEAMDSVQQIQGDEFRNMLALIMNSTQLMRMMSMTAMKHEEDELVQSLAAQTAHVLAKASSMLADAYDMPEEKVNEIMKWVDTLNGHIEAAMKEANK